MRPKEQKPRLRDVEIENEVVALLGTIFIAGP
jgi:hypothetical protein